MTTTGLNTNKHTHTHTYTHTGTQTEVWMKVGRRTEMRWSGITHTQYTHTHNVDLLLYLCQ